MSAHLAGGLTPLLVTLLLGWMNWRSLFALFGSIGFVWSLAWYRWFRNSPAEHPAVSVAERDLIESSLGGPAGAGHAVGAADWKRLLANRTVVCLCLMYFTQAFGGTFYVTWLPTYLASRGLTGMTAGVLAGLPLVFSAVADLVGGIATDRAAGRFGLRMGRVTIGGGALAAAVCSLSRARGSPRPWRRRSSSRSAAHCRISCSAPPGVRASTSPVAAQAQSAPR